MLLAAGQLDSSQTPPPPAPPAPPLSGHTPIALHLAMIALLSQREQFIIVFIYAFIDWNVGSCDL